MLHLCNATWGATTLIESDPVLAVVRNATYLPVSPTTFLDRFDGWGLYQPNGDLIQEAAYYRLPDHVLIGQSQHAGALPDAELAPDGNYLYGGPVIMHYGHFLTTALARLWPIVRDGLTPGTKIVVHSHQTPQEWFTRDYVRTLLGALRLTPDDFLCLDVPTRFRRIVVPRPAIEEQNYVHRVFGELCRHIRDSLFGTDLPFDQGGPVYLSKARHRFGTTKLVNEEPVQDFLASHGVETVYPETLSMNDQIRALSRATCLIGTVGSGFHTSLFCAAPRRIVGLAYSPTLNSNFHLIDRVTANKATYVYAEGTAEINLDDATFGYTAPDPAAIGTELLALSSGLQP